MFEFRQFIDAIKLKNDIVQTISAFIPLDRYHKALCPFHVEKTPSFSVNAKGQYFHCFGCGAGGDVITFLMLIRHISFAQALEELARSAGLTIPSLSDSDTREIEKDRLKFEILSATAHYYHNCLIPEVRDYLIKKRGFSELTISDFQIGYANGGLREHLVDKRGYHPDDCVNAGVLKQTPEGKIRDYFYNRVIFPNRRCGQIVHLSGRSFDVQEPKYLHLPGKIDFLFNEDALHNKEIIIAEGIPDCITAIQAGYAAVGLYGVNGLKTDDASKFPHCDQIYICLDPDRAGECGAARVAKMLGDKCRIIRLPEGIDLNDFFLKHPKSDFENLKSEAKNLIRWQLDLIPTDMGKVELASRLKPILQDLSKIDPPTAEAYLSHEIKNRFTLSKDDIVAYRRLIKQAVGENKPAKSKSAGKENKPKYIACFDGLIDLVSDDGFPAFLIKENDDIVISSEVEINGITYFPPPKEQIPWLLPRADMVLKFYEMEKSLTTEESDSALFEDLREYHKRISELPADEYYDLVVAWDFHTYLLEQVQYSPIICLFAVPERGKTRTGKGMIYIAYRGIHVESLRDAYIIRVANDLNATLFFDVKDIWRKAEKFGSEDILLQRFERGSRVPRVLFPDRGAHQDTVYYQIFGPTIIGTNEAMDRILDTRAVQINMPETSRQFETDLTPGFALQLKERLVSFRARHIGQSFPDIRKPSKGRLGDILKPLLQIIKMVKPERENAFLNLVLRLEGERQLEKSESIEALILATIIGLEDKVERGILSQKNIMGKINEDRPEKQKFTPQLIGRRLSALGFKKAKTGNGGSAIIWDKNQIDQISGKYGLGNMSETSVTSVNQPTYDENTDLSEDTEVLDTIYRESFL